MLQVSAQAKYDADICGALKQSVFDSNETYGTIAGLAGENPCTLYNHLNERTPPLARDIRTVFVGVKLATGRTDYRPLEVVAKWVEAFPVPIDGHFLRKTGGAKAIRKQGVALICLGDRIEGHEDELRGKVLREALEVLDEAIREAWSAKEELLRRAM